MTSSRPRFIASTAILKMPIGVGIFGIFIGTSGMRGIFGGRLGVRLGRFGGAVRFGSRFGLGGSFGNGGLRTGFAPSRKGFSPGKTGEGCWTCTSGR
ncbi:MAG: hypothetical protein [Circular genetic element sp.]|nr:MAG: hypothetical protein [Circular genetic element sp.]